VYQVRQACFIQEKEESILLRHQEFAMKSAKKQAGAQ
jgi:hypothetical protein